MTRLPPRRSDEDGECSSLDELRSTVDGVRDSINEISNSVNIFNTRFEYATAEIGKQWDAINVVVKDCKDRDQEAKERDDRIWAVRSDVSTMEERFSAIKKRLDSIDGCIRDLVAADKELYKMTWKQIGMIAAASAVIGALAQPIVPLIVALMQMH